MGRSLLSGIVSKLDTSCTGRFQDVRRAWRSFLYRLKKWKKGVPFDYVYLIEGRHGDHRYYISS